ncbi:head GIN domain-containing protein [Myxococcus sp. RHSTA-1-4]|uniref:head GIN domain-containing protein n=1 Tax=Myxococcus sp. RHSTA-1-4 TaxID=2874601 RepID=UPI001CC0FBAF|nr:head GIN domain-containing protein [Myxococcus sp. RHSTA-1-4]MBZ4418629.1 DUF2807 domain-containing protein [Myxococcus sp. RHSTA-1-4]
MDATHRGHWAGLSLLVTLLTGCGPHLTGSGNVIAEERETSDFVAVEIEDGIEATIVVDPTQARKVRLTGDDNLVERLRTEVAGDDTLRIHFPRQEVAGWTSDNPLRAEVTVPDLKSLQVSGGSTLDLSGTLSSPSFSLEASGGSRVRGRELDAESLRLELSGGSEAALEGYAYRVTSTLSGGSRLLARGLSSEEASMNSSGGSTNVLQVSDTLTVTASGGSTVTIIGRPTVRSEELSGGSTLKFE